MNTHQFVDITVNGQGIRIDGTKPLLQGLLENGFDVPNLCYMQELEAYGGCGLCLVEIDGFARPARACAVQPFADMIVRTSSERIERSRKATLAFLLSDHRGDCRPPCWQACPSNQDCQGYMGLIANGQFDEAFRLIMGDNPLPACIGRVCPHPCEEACRRELLEAPLSLMHLKRFTADIAGEGFVPAAGPPSGKGVAVVGAGPAGLSAAYFLRKNGHHAEIFEQMPAPGGMLRYGIPAYRLPKDVIDREVKRIEDMGAIIHYGQKLGQDVLLETLRQRFDAVFVAVGAWASSPLRCENDGLPGVLGGIQFLEAVASGSPPAIGNRVAVVGGGNTAMDAARTCIRLGAAEVHLLYRRTRSEMPAEAIEIEEAEEEGVRFTFLVAPERVLEAGGRASGLSLRVMRLGEPDDSGRQRPEPTETLREMPFDTVIAAIGQQVKPDGIESLEKHRWQTIVANPQTFETNIPGVFAGGDAINDGPGIAITAIGHGKRAARVIDSYLHGHMKPIETPFFVTQTDITREDLGPVETVQRASVRTVDPGIRKHTFDAYTEAFTPAEAMREASRCLECGCCDLYDCRLLPLLDEYRAREIPLEGRARKTPADQSHPFIWRDENKCVLCGLCVRVCGNLVGATALGFAGRGFEAAARPAFDWPLLGHDCISCGHCAAICPTGALQERRPFSKSPPLPPETEPFLCELCPRGCRFTLHRYAGRVLKAVPLNTDDCCSIGRYMPVVGDMGKLTETQREALEPVLRGDLRAYVGEAPEKVL